MGKRIPSLCETAQQANECKFKMGERDAYKKKERKTSSGEGDRNYRGETRVLVSDYRDSNQFFGIVVKNKTGTVKLMFNHRYVFAFVKF